MTTYSPTIVTPCYYKDYFVPLFCFTGLFIKTVSYEIILNATALWHVRNFPGGSEGKASACSAGALGSIPGLGRSPGGGHGNSLQHSCLKNPHGQRSLVGCTPWGCKESDTTEQLHFVTHYYLVEEVLHHFHHFLSQACIDVTVFIFEIYTWVLFSLQIWCNWFTWKVLILFKYFMYLLISCVF